MTPKDVIKMAQENKAVRWSNFKFLDFPGIWQHFAVPVDELTEEIFEEGLGFDGSSHPRLAGDPHERHARRARRRRPPSWIPSWSTPTLSADLQHRRPDHQGALRAATRATSPRRRKPTSSPPASATPAYFGPEAGVLHLRRRPLRPELP
ncbi:MAG: glutamine synthetase [Desulfobacterales bacterium]|nr:glutamine synthetase [Desulfobacterales bacterium]